MRSDIDSSFSRESINYSMVWEDPSLLFAAVPKDKAPNILSIGSAGCNCLALLLLPQSRVTAIDLSAPQTYLINLKKEAVKSLNQKEYLHFFDYIKNTDDKIKTYQLLRDQLDYKTRNYWDMNQEVIKSGIIHNGRLESYFKSFSEAAIKRIFSQQELSFISNNHDIKAQVDIIHKHQDAIEIFMTDFFNRDSLAKKGRSEAQFKFVNEELSVEMELIKRTLKALSSHLVSENPYLYYIFNGHFNSELLPDHLKSENYERLKKRIDNLSVLNTDLESIVLSSPEKFNFFNLSDIFEYVSEEHFEALLEQIASISEKGSTISYWSLFVDRTPKKNNFWTKLTELSQKLHKADRVWFYNDYNVLEYK